jgi:hypothetical protein
VTELFYHEMVQAEVAEVYHEIVQQNQMPT